MIRDVYDMREYIQRELEGIEDYGLLHEIFCRVLRHRCIPYLRVREAEARQRAAQFRLFGENKRR